MDVLEEREIRHWDFWADFWSRLRPGKIIRTESVEEHIVDGVIPGGLIEMGTIKKTFPVKIDGEVVGTAEVDLKTGIAICRFDEGKEPATLGDYSDLGVSIGDKDVVIFREEE